MVRRCCLDRWRGGGASTLGWSSEGLHRADWWLVGAQLLLRRWRWRVQKLLPRNADPDDWNRLMQLDSPSEIPVRLHGADSSRAEIAGTAIAHPHPSPTDPTRWISKRCQLPNRRTLKKSHLVAWAINLAGLKTYGCPFFAGFVCVRLNGPLSPLALLATWHQQDHRSASYPGMIRLSWRSA